MSRFHSLISAIRPRLVALLVLIRNYWKIRTPYEPDGLMITMD
jgi:hypothetical protein